mgnify:CR=1 FL=1
MSLRPTAGARYLLERVSADDSAAVYRAAIFTPVDEFAFRVELGGRDQPDRVAVARVDADAAPMTGSAAEPARAPTDEQVAQLTMFAKLLLRSATRVTPAEWPQRQLRWRGPGRGRT